MKNNLKTIILAGGFGQRMNSETPKALHKVLDKTLLDCILDSCKQADLKDIYIIVGYKHELIEEKYKDENVTFVLQEKQLGTGHAIMCAKEYIKDTDNILIINGDMPLLSKESINGAISHFTSNNFAAMITTVIIDDPTGYGRIVRDVNGNFENNIQQKDATEAELKIKEADLGMYLFKGKWLKKSFDKLSTNNAQKEYYLTDTLFHIKGFEKNVGVYTLENNIEAVNVNSKKDLAKMSKIYFSRINDIHLSNGVIITSPENTYISQDAIIGKDTVIYPGTIIEGKTVIGNNCFIGPNSRIIDSKIGNNTNIDSSKIMSSIIKDNVSIGPFSLIRNETIIGSYTNVGPYCEIKKSNLAEKVKASHHLYLGDCEIGNDVEIGCGTITANFNIHEEKHKTIIKDNVFIGSNVNLLAPITIEKDSIIAAGSTITENVKASSLAIARAFQVNKDEWAKNNK